MNRSQRPCLKASCLIGLVLMLSACSARNTDPDENGNESPDSSAPFGAQNDPNANPILLDRNYSSIVGHALSYFANEQFPGPRLPRIGPPDFTQPQSSTIDPVTGIETGLFTCSNGGEATLVVNESDPFQYEFTNCQHENALLDGRYALAFGKYNTVREFDNFVADINGGTAIHEVTGAITFQSSSPPCTRFERTRVVEQYKITLADRTFEIKDWNTTFEQALPAGDTCTADNLEITGRFSLRSAVTDNNWLVVTAAESITGTASNPTAGIVTISAADGSSITLDFANGIDDSVGVTINNSNGENKFNEPLSSWINSLLP